MPSPVVLVVLMAMSTFCPAMPAPLPDVTVIAPAGAAPATATAAASASPSRAHRTRGIPMGTFMAPPSAHDGQAMGRMDRPRVGTDEVEPGRHRPARLVR